jgi:predicted nucleic acid-binding protein
MNAVDTNVWIYSYDARDPAKQQQAGAIVTALAGAHTLILPWQVGCEFLAASRKLLPQGFTNDLAWQALANMRRMSEALALPDALDWDAARQFMAQDMLSFWDALLLATCIRHGVATLYTEDMGSPRTIRGVQLRHPFPPAP